MEWVAEMVAKRCTPILTCTLLILAILLVGVVPLSGCSGPSTPSTPSVVTQIGPGVPSEPGSVIHTLTPALQWNGVSGVEYDIAISKYPYALSNIVYSVSSVYGVSWPVPSNTLSFGEKYAWQVKVHDSDDWREVTNRLYFQTTPAQTPSPTPARVTTSALSPTASPAPTSTTAPTVPTITPTRKPLASVVDIKLLGVGSAPTLSPDGKTVAVLQSPHNLAVIDVSSKARLVSIPLSNKTVLGHTDNDQTPDTTAKFLPGQNKVAVITKGYWSDRVWDHNNSYNLQVVTIEPPVTRNILEYKSLDPILGGGSGEYVWPSGVTISGDGATFSFAGYGAGGASGIFVIDSFGITPQINIANNIGYRFPAFSPDDSFVYFVYDATGEIFRVRQNGLQLEKTALSHPRLNVHVTGLDINKKTGLMLVSYENAIIVQDLEGKNSTVLEIPVPKIFQAQWGPDGRTIVFSTGPSVGGSVYLIQLDLQGQGQ